MKFLIPFTLTLFFTSFFTFFFPFVSADLWAVLVCGSSGIENYRHQSDIAHAYRILRENGVPPENIITMSYDDVPLNPDNPFSGVLLNQVDTENVYEGMLIDYNGTEVTPANFLNVLAGKSIKGRKVLNTTADDDIFIYFSDHGGTGLICFPDGELYAHQLISALQSMHQRKRYNTIVMYVEACESGSMFNNLLPSNLNIFVMTASSPFESSWACCFDDHVQNYLGDVFSVNWLFSSTFEYIFYSTVGDHFELVKNQTTTSTVCEYGDLSLRNASLSTYLMKKEKYWYYVPTNHTFNSAHHPNQFPQVERKNVINSVDANLEMRYRRIDLAGDSSEREKRTAEWTLALHQRRLDYERFGDATEQVSRLMDKSCHSKTQIDSECIQETLEKFKETFDRPLYTISQYIKGIVKDCIIY